METATFSLGVYESGMITVIHMYTCTTMGSPDLQVYGSSANEFDINSIHKI